MSSLPKMIAILALVLGLSVGIDGQGLRVRLRVIPAAGVGGTCASDPTTCPLIHEANFTEDGAFRMPTGNFTGASDNFTGSTGVEASGGRFMAFDPADSQIYITCFTGAVAKMSPPALSTSSTIASLNTATITQNCYDPAEGHIAADISGGLMQGIMVDSDNSKLIGTSVVQFDSGGTQTISHFKHSLTLATSSWSGWSELRTAGIISRYFSGYMFPIPTIWRTLLGGKAITGNCCQSIISTTSNGMSAASFDPADVGAVAQPTINPLVWYTNVSGQDALGQWDAQTTLYGSTTDVNGGAIIEGTRTLVYFGRNGAIYCYGVGTDDRGLVGLPDGSGSTYCYDPWSTSHGQHSDPYYYQFWLYDLNDLAAVKAGTKQPYEVIPYEYFDVTFTQGSGGTPPSAGTSYYGASYGGGLAYDKVHQYLYVGQAGVDNANGVTALAPVIHRFTITVP